MSVTSVASATRGEPGEECDAQWRPSVVQCPVCGGDRVHYSFSLQTVRVVQCTDCSFSFCAEQPRLTSANAAAALESLVGRYGSFSNILDKVVGDLAISISSVELADWDMDGTVRVMPCRSDLAKSLTDQLKESQQQRLIVSVGQLEAFSNPVHSLRVLYTQLQEGDITIFIFSDMRHFGANIGTREWERLIDGHAAYLDSQTATKVLFRAGFRSKGALRLQRRVSLLSWLESNEPVLKTWKRRLLRLLPQRFLRHLHVTVALSDVAIVASRRKLKEPLLSVIIPVFNEAATVRTVIDSVLGIHFEGAQIELIVVESNSNDGSREIVQGYAGHPRVTCIFEDSPHGKGHAIRLGLNHARGDVLMIQDADLEYDFEDYHSLIDPILRGREAFILGSRHGGRNRWKLRRFAKPLLAKAYNIAHVFVTAYINVLFGLRLRDPQTMFKVFRRDCIEGIDFRSNYFNFDYELLLKIVRKGYKPREIPVNYRSRSHAEGKKIRMWRDAPLGLWTITKLRFTPLSSFLAFGERVE
jgi:glycosyl transferase family 2